MRPGATLSILVCDNELGGRGRGVMFRVAGGIGADDVNSMARHAGGVVAVAMSEGRAFALDLAPMVGARQRPGCPNFLASVEAFACRETGISAADRAITVDALGSWGARPADFHAPGHVMPATVTPGGRLETIIDVAHAYCAALSGALATAWCDILDQRGNVASADDCRALARLLDLPLIERDVAVAAIASARASLLRAA